MHRYRRYDLSRDRALVVAVAPPLVGDDEALPGKHAINGLFRVGYVHAPDDLSMVSVPLIANITGTE